MPDISALTVGQIFQHVKRQFGDEAAVQVTESDIIRWINDAQREACMQNEGLLESLSNIELNPDTNYYDLTDYGVLSLKRVQVRDSTEEGYYDIKWLSNYDFNVRVDTRRIGSATGSDNGRPRYYTKEGHWLKLYPRPLNLDEQGIRIIFNKYPTPVTDTFDALELPPEYHSFIQNFCVMQAYEMDEDWVAADRKAQQVQGDLDFNSTRQTWFGRDTFPSIGVPPDDLW